MTTAVEALGALAQETRLVVFRLLVHAGPGGLPAGEIAQRIAVPPATLSFHLKELVRAGLIAARRESRQIFYAADFTGMRDLIAFLTEDCCGGHPEVCAVPGIEPATAAERPGPRQSGLTRDRMEQA